MDNVNVNVNVNVNGGQMSKNSRIAVMLTEANNVTLAKVMQDHHATRQKGDPRLRCSPFWTVGEMVYFSGPADLLALVQAAS